MIAPAYSLRDGNSIPAIGLGTYGLNDQSGIEAIVSGIADGYRLSTPRTTTAMRTWSARRCGAPTSTAATW